MKIKKYLLLVILGLLPFKNIYSQSEQDKTRSSATSHKVIRPIPLLLEEIKQGDSKQREILRKELADMPPSTGRDVELLGEMATDAGGELKKAAIESLTKVTAKDVHLKNQYIKLLNKNDKEVQRAAMYACGQLNAKEAAPQIATLLKKHPRHTMAKFIWAEVANDSAAYVYQAAEALVQLDHFEAVDAIMERDEIMANYTYGGPLVARFGAKAIPKLVDYYRRGGHNKDAGLSGIIYMRDESAVPQLVSLLKDQDKQIVNSSLWALAVLPVGNESLKKRMEATIAPLLSDKDQGTRSKAYECLLHIAPDQYLPQAMEALQKDPEVRLNILYALMRNPNPKAVPYLEQFIRWDEAQRPNEQNLRAIAAQTIYKISGRRVPYKGFEKDQKIYKDPYIGQ